MIDTCFGLGFMLGSSFGAANPPRAFGHAGAGGSLAFADPDAGLAFGYVMKRSDVSLKSAVRGRKRQRSRKDTSCVRFVNGTPSESSNSAP